MWTHAKYKLILKRWVRIMLQSVNMRTLCVIKNINMSPSYAGESLGRKVPMESGGAAHYSLCFHFGCCSCATDKPWPESCLCVFILSSLLHVVWLWSKIIGLCSMYCLVSLDKRTSTWYGEGHLFQKDGVYRHLQMNFRKIHNADFISNSSAQHLKYHFYYTKCHFLSIYKSFFLFDRICHVAYRKWWM